MNGKCKNCESVFGFPDMACTVICPNCGALSWVEKEERILNLISDEELEKAPAEFRSKAREFQRRIKRT